MSVEKPQFTQDDLPLTTEQLRERETWMMEVGNWRGDHSAPSVGEHYRYMWKWDSYKAIVINARRQDPKRSRTEFLALEEHRDKQTGFLSNKIFATAEHKTWRDYPEAWNFNDNKIGTSYSQPPIAAWAASETYESFVRQGDDESGLAFLEQAYGTADKGNYTGLQGEYAYFINHRQNSLDDSLVGIVHPNETGRDSDEANKPWLTYSDKGGYDAKLEWLQMQKLGWDLGRLGRDLKKQRIDWIPEQTRGKYWVNDVMFNVMHANNLRHLADIAQVLSAHADVALEQERYEQDAMKYREIAYDAEYEILNRMWNPDKGFFYNLDSNGKQIPVDSITGLFPLLLENLTDVQATALFSKLEDPTWFNTEYPIPTQAVRSPFYDPDPEGFKNKLTPQWSGTVWTDMNHLLVEEGLVPRAASYVDPESEKMQNPRLSSRMLGRASIIASQTEKLLASSPKSMEYYSPETGRGMRVADFMWTNIGLHFENLDRSSNGLHNKI